MGFNLGFKGLTAIKFWYS